MKLIPVILSTFLCACGTYNPQESDVNSFLTKDYTEIAKKLGVSLEVTNQDTTGYKIFSHTKNVDASGALTIEQGRLLFFDGITPQIDSKDRFWHAAVEGVVPRYGSAQCAVTQSSILEHAAVSVSMGWFASMFNKQRRDDPSDPLSCTDEVETQLRKYGWLYYSKDLYVAPKGSIALMKGRYSFCGVPQHSGHIYSMLEDRGVGGNDLIADNGGYGVVYKYETGGFWLPLGVYPKKR